MSTGRGRGRAQTMPAWMENEGGGGEGRHSSDYTKGPDEPRRSGGESFTDTTGNDATPVYQLYGGGYMKPRSESGISGGTAFTDNRIDRGRQRERDRPSGSGRRGRSRSTSLDRKRRDKRRAERKARGSNFDVRPEGMDEDAANQLAAQAFLQQAVPNATPAIGTGMSSAATALLSQNAPSAQQTRHARRLYVGGIPSSSDTEVQNFFEDVLMRTIVDKKVLGGPAVVSVYLNSERGFSFVELRSVALTTAAMALDGILFKDHPLKVRRPSDYNASAVPPESEADKVHLDLALLGIVSTTVPDSDNKIFIGGLPYHLTEDQVKELLSAFGPLRALHLVRDAGATASKGYAFCEYMDEKITKIACEGLNGMALGDRTLTVRKAMTSGGGGGAGTESNRAGGESGGAVTEAAVAVNLVRAMPPTTVLVLLNMVQEDELKDEEEYEVPPFVLSVWDVLAGAWEIVDDIQEESAKYGSVKTVIVPRPSKDGSHMPGVGKVFVKYGTQEEAQTAALALAGRQFASRVVKSEKPCDAASYVRQMRRKPLYGVM